MQAIELTFRPSRPADCRVRIGVGALDRLVEDLVSDPVGDPLVMVSDDRVAELWGAPLVRRLGAAGLPVELLTFPAGEASKAQPTKDALEARLLALGAGRQTVVIAVGGGVTGDLAGFLAATWHRGVPVIQVPTSLLAMVDASIGGKTAINLSGGKNLVGAFHQPRAIYADVRVLETLPDAHYRAGFAEVIKTGAIADAALFARLESSGTALRARDAATLEQVVADCVRVKGRIVAADERENDLRAALNFGHTVAHALETVTDYALSHGEAVAVGLCVEAELARSACGFPDGDARRLERLVRAFGLPVAAPAPLDVERLLEAMRVDKKSRGGRPRFALPRRIGEMPAGAATTCEVPLDAVRAALLLGRDAADSSN